MVCGDMRRGDDTCWHLGYQQYSKFSNLTKASDLNTAPYGVVGIMLETANRPFGYGICLTFGSIGYTVQIAVENGGGSMFTRGKNYDGDWTSWNEYSMV